MKNDKIVKDRRNLAEQAVFKDLPNVKFDHRALCRYASEQGKSIKELSKEEVYQYLDWTPDEEFKLWRKERIMNWESMSRTEQISMFERWIAERNAAIKKQQNME